MPEQRALRNASGMRWHRRSSRVAGADASTSATSTGDAPADETSGLPAGASRLPPGPGDTDTFNSVTEAFLHLPDAIVMVDMEGTIVWGNVSAERTFGRSFEDWVGRSGLDLVHPDDQELVLRSLVSIQAKDVGSPIELRIKAASGWRLVEVVGTTVQWYGHRVILLSLRDLTERRRYELASGHEARFRSLVQNAGSIIMLLSSVGTLESVSGAITRLLGHDPEQLEQRPLLDIVDPADRTKLAGALTAASHGASSAHPVSVRVGLLRHDGTEVVPFEMSIVDLLDDPTVEGFVISAHDATVQTGTEHELGQALSLLTATLDSTADGILVIDNDGFITTFNGRFSETWHIPEEEWKPGDEATKLAFVLDQLVSPEGFLATWRELGENPDMETFDSLEFKDGRVVELYSKAQRIEGEIVGRVWSFRDTTDRTRLEDELEYRAFHDPLTGLANKALFQDRLEHALARIEQTRSHLAVLFIDLDDFKTVNDSLGHSEGDLLLKRVATTLVECLRPLDTAARMGGDEFAILIEDVQSREDITELAQRILESLRPLVLLGSKAVSSAGSVGIAFDVEGITCEQLLRNADIAMYKAKEAGKNRYEVYRDEMHALVLGSHRIGRRAAGGNPWREPDHPLPADLRPADERRGRVRGPGAVVASTGRVGGPAPLRLHRGGDGPGRRDRHVRVALGLPPGVRLARRRPRRSGLRHERQRVGRPAGRPGAGGADRRRRGAVGVRPVVADARDHRERGPHRERGDRAQPVHAAGVGHPHRARRLRHRLLLAVPPGPVAGRHRQDRQVLRAGARDEGRHAEHGGGHDPAGPHVGVRHHRRGRGETLSGGEPARMGCRLAQGYQLGRPADAEQTRLLLVTDDRREQLADHLWHPQQPGG